MTYFTQPLDLDPKFNLLFEEFGRRKTFTRLQAEKVLGLSTHRCRAYLSKLSKALEDCPEGLQLRVKPGYKGGYYFQEGSL